MGTVTAPRSTSNPGFNGNATLKSYPPMGGKIGDLIPFKADFVAAGPLSRSTS